MDLPDIDPDMVPPSGKTVSEMLGDTFKRHKEPDEPQPKARAKSPTQKAKEQAKSLDQIHDDLVDGYQFLSFVLMPISPNGAEAMQEGAEKCADAWVRQAEKSPRVMRFLTTITEGGGWLAIAMVHFPIAMAIQNDMRTRGQQGGMPQNMEEQVRSYMQDNFPDGQTVPNMETIG